VEERLGSRDAGRNGTRIDGRAGEIRAEEKEGKGDGFGRERGFMLTMGMGSGRVAVAKCFGERVLGCWMPGAGERRRSKVRAEERPSTAAGTSHGP